MPQLDKYIFFEQIICLTIFFFLIYKFIRRLVVPEISTILKYRKKRISLFIEQLEAYDKILNFSKSIVEKKGKNFNFFQSEYSILTVFSAFEGSIYHLILLLDRVIPNIYEKFNQEN